MLVKIAKQALRIGMFVEAVDCPYWEFQKRQFLLSDVEDLCCITRSTACSVTTNKAHSPETPQGSKSGGKPLGRPSTLSEEQKQGVRDDLANEMRDNVRSALAYDSTQILFRPLF